MDAKSVLEAKIESAKMVKWRHIHDGNIKRVRECNVILKRLRNRLKYITTHTKEQVLFT